MQSGARTAADVSAHPSKRRQTSLAVGAMAPTWFRDSASQGGHPLAGPSFPDLYGIRVRLGGRRGLFELDPTEVLWNCPVQLQARGVDLKPTLLK